MKLAKPRTETSLLIVFTNLSRFAANCVRRDDVEIVQALDGYYESIGMAVDRAGGAVVKFIGDGALLVFPEEAVDQGVGTLFELKDAVDKFMAERGWECSFNAKVHFGKVIAGEFGKRFDVIGKAVNTAAMLDSTGVTLSVEAFRTLGADMRTHFKKHTPPITYLRIDDPRPFRRSH